MIITIDGFIATGKSSIAKMLAKEIGYIYFDTGSMFRALTYALLHQNIQLDDEEQLAQFLNQCDLDIKIKLGSRFYYVQGEDITPMLRLPEVTATVSRVAALAPVRYKLLVWQRELAKGVNSIFEGRDMGSTVFPDADLKIFLTGRLEVRARRRYEELKSNYPDHFANLTFEECMEQIKARDESDMNRELSPLKKADDAYEIDTSDLSLEEIIEAILDLRSAKKMNQT